MPTRTGTASQVDARAASSSASVTVPADATAAVAFWAGLGTNDSHLSSLALGANSFTELEELPVTSGNTGTGVALLTSLPGTGTQTLAWSWSSGARSEGGGMVIVWLKDVNSGDPYSDTIAVDAPGNPFTGTLSPTSDTDLILAMGQSFGSTTGPLSPAVATFVDNFTNNSEAYDVAEITASAGSTDISLSGTSFSTLAAVALKVGVTTQTLLPSADSVDGTWTDSSGGTSLAAQIDETSASDTDYIRSVLGPSNAACRVKLATGSDPASSTGHIIHWRVGKDTTGGATIGVTVKLYQGGGDSLGAGTLIASFTRANVDALTTYDETLSGGEADSITNYGDLYLEFSANQT